MFLCIVNNIVAYNSNGYMTKYTYSPTGEKLRVTHQTAVPNISVPIGSTRELAPYEIQYTDSTDYLLGGSLTLRNGRIDKYQFEEGYCQAERYVYDASQDEFTFCYYDRDHLGNIREVMNASGSLQQRTNYYPFGGIIADICGEQDIQPYKYNGKELDLMHGLNTYDYGARQYFSILGRWDRMDPLCEKYYSVSPYAYCGGNPIRFVDVEGEEIWIYYTDERGETHSFQYYFGMQCNVDNSFAQEIVSNLNTMYTNNSGSEVLNALIGCSTKYGYTQDDTLSEGGEGYFNTVTKTTSLNDATNVFAFAEETFHMYQHLNNQSGKTAVNEVEAKLFSTKMVYEIDAWLYGKNYQDKLSGKSGSPYYDSMSSLLLYGYDEKNFKTAVNNFFSASLGGQQYKDKLGYSIGEVKQNPLIKKFLPVN